MNDIELEGLKIMATIWNNALPRIKAIIERLMVDNENSLHDLMELNEVLANLTSEVAHTARYAVKLELGEDQLEQPIL